MKAQSSSQLEKALLALRHALTCELTQEAKTRGCSLTHFEALKYIAEQGNPTMKDIASRLGITPPSTSSLIEALAKRKLIERIQTAKDRRTVRITLAPKAQMLLSSIYKQKNSIFKKMLSRLNGRDKEELARIIIKLT